MARRQTFTSPKRVREFQDDPVQNEATGVTYGKTMRIGADVQDEASKAPQTPAQSTTDTGSTSSR